MRQPDIRWKKPPPSPLPERKTQDWWEQVFAMLRAKPNEWACIASYRSKSGAQNAVVTALTRHGQGANRFEWVVRSGDDPTSVDQDLYMRFKRR